MNDQSQPQDAVLAAIGDDFLAELHLERLTPEERMQFLKSFLSVLYLRVIQRIADSITPVDYEKLESLMNENRENPGPVREYLVSRLPQLPQIEKEEVQKYVKELVEDINLRAQKL